MGEYIRSPDSLKPQSKAVLCIDDSQGVLAYEKAFLESPGFNVPTAPSGRKGLELASIYSFDVVIVDYSMPAMNGHEGAIGMGPRRMLAPIIMLSAAVDIPEQALRCVDAFVAKDHLRSQLLPAIAQLEKCGPTARPSQL